MILISVLYNSFKARYFLNNCQIFYKFSLLKTILNLMIKYQKINSQWTYFHFNVIVFSFSEYYLKIITLKYCFLTFFFNHVLLKSELKAIIFVYANVSAYEAMKCFSKKLQMMLIFRKKKYSFIVICNTCASK